MSETTYYQRNREVILNRANHYYENNKELLREREREQKINTYIYFIYILYTHIFGEEKNKKRIWKKQISQYV